MGSEMCIRDRDRTDQQINDLIEKYSNYKIQFASENKNLKLWTE